MSFTKVAPAGIGTEPGTSIRIGDSLLHSTGIDIGSNTGIGVTIRKHGDATFTGIVTAASFSGSGANLTGIDATAIKHTDGSVKAQAVATGVNVTGNLGVSGVLTYEDVTNIDSVGVVTARSGIKIGPTAGVAGTFFADGSYVTAGIITATTFHGSGANLTNLNASSIASGTVPTARLGSGTANSSTFLRGDSTFAAVTSTTINNNADNRVITGSGSANTLEGESGLTYNGTRLDVTTGDLQVIGGEGGNAELRIVADQGDDGADYWRFQSAASSNNLNIATYASGAWVDKVSIDSAGRVQIGHTSSIVGGRVELHANTAETQITINESSDSGSGPALYINRTRGSNIASPGPIQDGNYMGSIHFGSYDTNSYEKGASIQARADGQTWADGDCPTRLSLWTTRDAESNPREWMRIWNDGTLTFARGGSNQVHNTTHLNGKHRYSFDYSTDDSSVPYRGMRVYGSYGIGGGSTDYSYAALFDGGKTHNNCLNQYITFNQITQQLTAHTHGIYCENSSSYGVSYCYEGKMIKNLGAYTNSYTYNSNIVATNAHAGSAYHFRGEDNGTDKVLILKNGDLDNANNSYSGISDIKLKENIVDAGSQWDDIKNLKVRKFNFKAETGHETHTQIGLIAQETEPVSAGLVYGENDITIDESTGEGTVTGTTKHIKYSVLYMKAIKGLQEAMTRIETLEAEVTALKGS